MNDSDIRDMLIKNPVAHIEPACSNAIRVAARWKEFTNSHGGDSFTETLSWRLKIRPNQRGVSVQELLAIADDVKSPLYPDLEADANVITITVKTVLWQYETKVTELLAFVDKIRTAELAYSRFKTMTVIRDNAERSRRELEEARAATEKARQEAIQAGLGE